MSRQYLASFYAFEKDVKHIEQAKNASFSLSDEILNAVAISGEIRGKDTKDTINRIGQKHGLLILAQELSVIY